MIAELRALNPKPGHAFGSEPVQPVIPDVIVRASPEGAWIVELNTDTLPRVLINNQYLARVSTAAARSEDKLYLSECQANATWLVKSLDQRARTILKVAREIVRQQDAFLVLGVQHLRPLNLRTVAEAIEMHEFDGEPRHLQQVHGNAARHLRAQVLLHHRDRLLRCRRRRPFGRSRAPPHQGADRPGGRGGPLR